MVSIEEFIFEALFYFLMNGKYQWTLPLLTLHQWNSIWAMTRESQDRLEWLGDLLIDGSVTSVLHELFPSRGLSFYMPLRKALVRNMLFACLWINAGIPRAKVLPQVKAYADYFEVIIAVFVGDGDVTPLDAWVKETFRPLMFVAQEAFLNYKNNLPHPFADLHLLKRPASGPPASPILQSKKPRRDNDALGEVTNLNLVPVASSSKTVNFIAAPTTPTIPRRLFSDAAVSPVPGLSRHRPIDLTKSP